MDNKGVYDMTDAEILNQCETRRQPVECWKDVVGYVGKYQVSDMGRVKSIGRKRLCRVNGGTVATMNVREKILKQWKRGKYMLVDLWNNSKRDVRSIHSLVYSSFSDGSDGGEYVHHKDGNKTNNRFENLTMVSCQEHNKIHHCGKVPWNKGKKMSPDVLKKAWETRRNKNVKC